MVAVDRLALVLELHVVSVHVCVCVCERQEEEREKRLVKFWGITEAKSMKKLPQELIENVGPLKRLLDF